MRRPLLLLAVLAAAGILAAALAAARGDLDPTFGSGGKVTTDFGGNETASALALQRDGKIVVAGRRFDPGPSDDFVLARYTANGSLDRSFDGDGKVTTDFGGHFDGASGVAVQTDGRIVAVGAGFPATGPQDFALARYNDDGSLDQTFGSGGKVLTSFGPSSLDAAWDVVVQPDGKIVAAGRTRSTPTYDFAIARYLPNGTLDSTFDGDGVVITPVTHNHDYILSVALQPDGKIVAGGFTTPEGGGTVDLAVARYNRDGSLDSSFDGDGVLTGADRSEVVSDIAVLPDGKLLLAAFSAVVRLNVDGTFDTSFGQGGRSRNGPYSTTVVVQPDRKILVVGLIPGAGSSSDIVVARLMPGGLLDGSYGRNGSVVSDFGPEDQAGDAALQSNGRLVVAGFTRQTLGTGPADFVVARYLAMRFCVVPNVRGRTLKAARSALTRAFCQTGKIHRVYARKVKEGRVISQRPRAGARLPEPAKVNLVVSRGRRR